MSGVRTLLRIQKNPLQEINSLQQPTETRLKSEIQHCHNALNHLSRGGYYTEIVANWVYLLDTTSITRKLSTPEPRTAEVFRGVMRHLDQLLPICLPGSVEVWRNQYRPDVQYEAYQDHLNLPWRLDGRTRAEGCHYHSSSMQILNGCGVFAAWGQEDVLNKDGTIKPGVRL